MTFIKKRAGFIMTAAAVSMAAAIAAAGLVWYVFRKKQSYSSSIVIEYVNKGAEDGYAADGTKIDPEPEIKGSEVLSNAIDKLGVKATPEEIAARLKIEEVIPEDEQERIDSANKNGKTDYRYVPTEYKITLSWDADNCAKILSAVTSSYFSYYAREHVIQQQLPADSALYLTGAEDYIEAVDILSEEEQAIEGYLSSMEEKDGAFRCVENGYSWSDAAAKAGSIKDSLIARLYADILGNKASKDPEMLVMMLQKENENGDAENKDLNADLDEVVSLIKSYSEKNRADSGTGSSDDSGTRNITSYETEGEEDPSNKIDENRSNISDWVYRNASRPKTEYDEIMARYISEKDRIGENEADKEWNSFLIDIFKDADEGLSADTEKKISAEIDALKDALSDLYCDISAMSDEQEQILAAKNISLKNTPIITPKIRVKLYAAAAGAAVFLLLITVIPLLRSLLAHLDEMEKQNKE